MSEILSNKEDILEIVDGIGEYGVLKKSNLFKEENIIEMSLLLNVGYINDLENLDTKTTCNNEINVKEKIDKLKEKLKEHKIVRIWYSSLDSEDYNLFMFLVYLINKIDNNISIKQVDVGKIKKTDKIKFGALWSLGCYDEKEVEGLLEFDKELSTEQINNISDEWKKFEKENSDLRILEKGKIKSKQYAYLDEKILEELLKYEEIGEIKLIVDLMLRERTKHDMGGINGQIIFSYRIKELIKQNKIKIVRIEQKKNISGETENINIIKNAINLYEKNY